MNTNSKKIYYRKFTEPVFRAELILVLGEDKKEVKKKLKAKYNIVDTDKFVDMDYAGLTMFNSDGSCVIHFMDIDPSIATISHETTHFVVGFLEHIGVSLKYNASDEVYAYYMGYWMNKIIDYISKIEKNKNWLVSEIL